MVPLYSLEGDADGVCKMLIKDEMYEEEDGVSSIGGATKAVGKGWIDGLPSVSRPVLIIPTVPRSFSGAIVVGGN